MGPKPKWAARSIDVAFTTFVSFNKPCEHFEPITSDDSSDCDVPPVDGASSMVVKRYNFAGTERIRKEL